MESSPPASIVGRLAEQHAAEQAKLAQDRIAKAEALSQERTGPRVFQGEPGSRHRVSDFVPFAKAKDLSKADRKYLSALRTGANDAWAEGTETSKVAHKPRDVETTGSVSPQRARR